MVQACRSRPLAQAFARRLRRTTLVFVAATVVVFVTLRERDLRLQAHRFLTNEGQLCAAALRPGRNGDLSASIARLQDRYERLLAVAALDAFGNSREVYPDRPAHRAAVEAALAAGSHCVTISAPYDGKSVSVAGVVVPVNGSPSPSARKVLVVLRADSHGIGWGRIALIFACLVGVGALFEAYLLRRWFDLRVVKPLRCMARSVKNALELQEQVPFLDPGDDVETIQLAERFRELFARLAESEARYRELEVDSVRRFQKRQRGFDRMLKRARDRAVVDPLTRLRNRTFLEEELDPFFEQHLRRKVDVAAIMIDVDNFKPFNDRHGHQVGDALLRFLGALLRGGIRPTDHAVRYGGDEFLLLLPDTSAARAAKIAERFVKLFGQHLAALDQSHNLSLSVGVTSIALDAPKNGQELVARADAALYAAKRKGKNMVVCRLEAELTA